RRDSFITHRAFCDALAQESSRPPTVGLHALGNHLYGNATAMASGLSQVNAHLSSLQAQSNAPTDLLRAGGRPGSQLEHLISSSTPSSFRPPQAPPPSAFYLDNGSTQDFNEDLQRSSTITSAATAAGVFDLGFFSHGNGNSGGNQNNRMLMADGFNSANGSTEPATLFSGNLMIDHVVGGTNSLYNTSMQSDWMLPQMSATALLQKAAQMGVTTSGGPSLLRGFARSSSSRCSFSGDGGDGGGGLQAQTENEAHLQNLMMTLANGGTDLFVGVHQQQAGGFRALDTGLCVMDETKFDPSGARNLGGSDQLTRDFLGVGSMVRSISSGVTRREPI
ncbi:zinc finger protein, partial [Musa troglodytarum]